MGFLVTAPFERGGPFPIDELIVMSKTDMAAVNDSVMPPVYFCVCEEDGKIYTYNKTNTADPTTGKYRLLDGGGSGTVDTTMSSTSENAVQNKVIKQYVDSQTRELTQTQYNALTDEEKNNGTTYFITDAQGGGGSSTIGRWEKIGEWKPNGPRSIVIPNLPEYNAFAVSSTVDTTLDRNDNTAMVTLAEWEVGTFIQSTLLSGQYFQVHRDNETTIRFEGTLYGNVYGYKDTAMTDADTKKLANEFKEVIQEDLDEKATGYRQTSTYTVVFDDDTMPKPTKLDTEVTLHLYTGDYDDTAELTQQEVTKLVNNETVERLVTIPGGGGTANLVLTPTSDTTMRYEITLPTGSDFRSMATTFFRLRYVDYDILPDRVRQKIELANATGSNLNAELTPVTADDVGVTVQLAVSSVTGAVDYFQAIAVGNIICRDVNNVVIPVVVTNVGTPTYPRKRVNITLKCLGSTAKTIATASATLLGYVPSMWE